MFDYAGVAVEIWEQILLAVIDLPYLLDTLVDREVEDWRNSARYHDSEAYTHCERQRRMLRLVCRSWQAFIDGYKYRWITYNSSLTEDVWKHGEALEAIQSITASMIDPEGAGGATVASRPRRILFNMTTDEDMELYRKTIDYCSSKATAFFVKCVEGYEDQIFEHMIRQSSKLPMLRCLELPAPTQRSNPLRSISAAFPKLIALEINTDGPYELRDGDVIILPELEILGVDISGLSAASLQTCNLPELIHLSTPLGRTPLTLESIRTIGANLTLLNIYRVHSPIRLPLEFWTWCPCLVEFLSFFSWIYLGTPAPTDHPLKYVIHWPHYDHLYNPLVEGAYGIETPAVLHSLSLLPRRVKVFVVWERWSAYLKLLARRYRQSERDNILLRISEICAHGSIRVEDEDRVGLDEFLASEGIGIDLRCQFSLLNDMLVLSNVWMSDLPLAFHHQLDLPLAFEPRCVPLKFWDLMVMFDYSKVAVEIWHQILLAVIDLPYILDTLVDRNTEYWRTSGHYDAPEIYVESEHHRKTLRLVCHSWRAFVDEYKHRRIIYDTRPSASNPAMQKEALEVINSAIANSAGQGNTVIKPRRIMFHVTSEEDLAQFKSTIDLCASKVTTLFVQSNTPEYEDPPFDYLITHSSKLPNLRCLAISPPNGHPMPLRALSMAFPNLYTFTIWGGQPLRPRGGDILALPDLEVLEMDLSVFQTADIKKWHLPGVINLRTAVGKDPEAPQMTLEPIRALGKNLIYINIYRVYGPIRLPVEFWTWFPRLVEMVASFSWIYLDAPAPVDHPLKYVVHWPHYDYLVNPAIARASNMAEPTILQTLQLLPPSVEQLVVWHRWSAYLELLSAQSRYGQHERERILTRMNEICVERSIKVEDQDGVALGNFLTKESIVSG